MNFAIIKFVVSVFLLIVIVILFKKYIKEYRIYESEKDKLFDFLYKKKEYEALKRLGAINPFGVREKWHIPSRKIRVYLNTRDDLLNEIEVKQFLKKLTRFEKYYMSCFMTSLLFIFILFFLYTG